MSHDWLTPVLYNPYCGRLDGHDSHEWLGRDWQTGRRVVRECPGAPVVEGGNPVHCCDECGLGVRDEDMAPSCGAHRLHDVCMAFFFDCRECDLVQQEVCS